MLKKVIAGYNAVPGAPADWDPKKAGADCVALPIRVDWDGPNARWCESAWEPTPMELEQLNAGGQVILRVWGWQPPVALYVEPPQSEEKTDDV